ncbi:phosphatase PAP2 family protein [Nocardia araoensis]|uniref:phosphatase PAP2 family protein n=1 Tax=Nocardia araoensis TaxID=228600 RepID=UPI0012F6EFEF|nr:phosphatase PAP2 family protein [Nocardia araoensis]
MSLDMDILRWLSQHRTPALTTVARLAMDAGMSNTVIAAAGVVGRVVVVTKRWWWQGITIAVSVVAAQSAARALKHMIQRERPPADLSVVQVGAFSIPSTVAAMTAAAAAAAAAAYLTLPWPTERRRWIAGLIATLVVSIGIAMVYLGAHWPTDVVAGWGVGVGVAGVVMSLARVAVRRPIRRSSS